MADVRSLVALLRRYPDPVASTDPMTSTLVARLSSLPSPPKPSPGFRADLRAQLVTVTPRLVAEGLTPVDAAVTPRGTWRRARAAVHRMPLRRPLAVVGTLVIIFGLLLSGAVWLSSNTLPGDSLYGLKRASENVQLSLTSGPAARGKEYLTLAKRRANEVSSLLGKASSLAGAAGVHAAGGISTHTANLVTDTLADADADLRNASRLLTGQAVSNRSNASLQTLLGTVPDLVSRLTAIVDRIPPGTLHDRAAGSEQLAERVVDRANRLRANIGCSCLTETSSDDLGPLPCTLPCNPPANLTSPAPPGAGGTTPPGGSSTAPSGAHSTATSGAASAPLPGVPGVPMSGSGPAGASPPTGTGSAPSGSSSSIGLPSLSLPASGPVAINSCGLLITLGTIGIGLGPCGLHLHL